MEIKNAGEFIVFKLNGFGVVLGEGENRRALSKRKRLWIGELKLDPTASNTIRCFDTVFQRPYQQHPTPQGVSIQFFRGHTDIFQSH